MIALGIWAGIMLILIVGLTLFDTWMLGRDRPSGPWPRWKKY